MLRLIVLLTLVAGLASSSPDCGDELVRKWNVFARDANQYLHTLDADPYRRLKRKEKLNREWEAVLSCECF